MNEIEICVCGRVQESSWISFRNFMMDSVYDRIEYRIWHRIELSVSGHVSDPSLTSIKFFVWSFSYNYLKSNG